MELSVKVFAIANGEDNLKKMYKIMQECVPVIDEEGYYLSKKTKVAGWVELVEREYDVWDRDDWDSMLEQCSEEMGEDGAVILVFSSPDSDTFDQHAATTASGDTIFCDTEYDYSDFENLDSRLDEFKEQFIGAYKQGEELYKWFEEKNEFSIPE